MLKLVGVFDINIIINCDLLLRIKILYQDELLIYRFYEI